MANPAAAVKRSGRHPPRRPSSLDATSAAAITQKAMRYPPASQGTRCPVRETLSRVPGLAVEQPEPDQQSRRDQQLVQEEVALRVELAPGQAWTAQHEQHKGPEQQRSYACAEQSDHGAHKPEVEEPELEMKRDLIGGPHEVEGNGLERRNGRQLLAPGAVRRTARRARRSSQDGLPLGTQKHHPSAGRGLPGGPRETTPRNTRSPKRPRTAVDTDSCVLGRPNGRARPTAKPAISAPAHSSDEETSTPITPTGMPTASSNTSTAPRDATPRR